MRYLLDVNVFIALIDDHHVHHQRATSWFVDVGHERWATSPIVQNGVVRIVGAPSYAAVPFSCAEVASIVREWCCADQHEFWPDEVSLVADERIDRARLTSPKRITDSYLLALAVHRRGKLVTLDRRLSPDVIAGGAEALHVIS